MKVESKNVDKLNIELSITVENGDYAEIERKKLADCRRKADFKGFRKGNVPPALIKKLYGEQILVESVNQVVSEQIDKFINDNKLNVLGEPLGSESQPEVEWKDGNDFTFLFDIATSPVIEFEVGKDDTVEKYNVTVAAKDKEEMKGNLKKYYEEQKVEKTEEEMDKEVADRLEENYRQEAEWRLTKDIKDYFVGKAGVEIPEAFLKRWLLAANKEKVSAEDVEKEFPAFAEDLKWQLVRSYLMKKYDFKVTMDDLQEAAKAYVSYQYAMYGLGNVPEDMIMDAAKRILEDRSQIGRMEEQVEDQKVLTRIREEITIKSKKITSAKFRELK